MLKKQHRLPGSAIPHLLNSPHSFNSPLLNLKTAVNSNKTLRFGFIVSTKIAKHAVDRNKIKRLLRQAVKPHLTRLLLGHDLLFFAKHPLKGKSLDQIQPHLDSLLKQANLFNHEKNSS